MLKANLNRVFLITLLSTSSWWIGCSSPEEIKTQQIEEARALIEKGDTKEALDILEELAGQYPNDAAILRSIGTIYSKENDHSMAAFFLEQAQRLQPTDTELLFQTYQSLESAGQSATHLLEKLANDAPAAMTPELWVRLGQLRQAEDKVQSALDAYLKGVNPEQSKPSAEVAAAIGSLFVKAGNLAQAENWLQIAADNDDPSALTALFGLLEINLRQKDWPAAEATITQLDQQFPGAVEASQWEAARQELVGWRKAQDAMQAKLAKAEAEKKAAETAAKAKAEAAAKAKAAATTATEITPATEVAEGDSSATKSPSEGKAQIITDLEAAEAMANTPAEETSMETPDDNPPLEAFALAEASGGKSITYDPSIAIEPADPAITFEVSYEEANIAEPTTYSVEKIESIEPAETLPTIEFPTQLPEATPVTRSSTPPTIEELLADAETAELDRNYKSAIRKYWAAISIANNRAEVWNLLSRAYLVDGQRKNAETTALEAVRLEPREVAYTLDYLRVAQRSKPPEDFLAELETAYDRFPTSPEITLSLARAHERISQNTTAARNLYLRFIDIAPNHPLVPEARDAAARL